MTLNRPPFTPTPEERGLVRDRVRALYAATGHDELRTVALIARGAGRMVMGLALRWPIAPSRRWDLWRRGGVIFRLALRQLRHPSEERHWRLLYKLERLNYAVEEAVVYMNPKQWPPGPRRGPGRR